MVGRCVLLQLAHAHGRAYAFSRHPCAHRTGDGVVWQQIPAAPVIAAPNAIAIPWWICIAPIAALPAHFAWLEAQGARRIVALSSTSRFTKDTSSDIQEQGIAQGLVDAENQVQAWAQSRGIEWVVLRPTLIYQPGQDKNVSEIARFIGRFSFFPVLGKAHGCASPSMRRM